MTNPATAISADQFLGLARAEYAHAVALERWRLGLQLGALGAASAALFVPPATVYWLSAISLVAVASAAYLGAASRAAQAQASRGLRRALLLDALGQSAELLDLAALASEFSAAAKRKGQPVALSEYYSSRAPQGPQRLLDHVQESAFYSTKLFRLAARASGWRAAVSVICALVALFVGIGTRNATVAQAVASLVVVFLTFVVASNEATNAADWSRAGAEAERLDRRVASMPVGADGDALAVFGDYCALHTDPPVIPNRLYSGHRDELAQLWSARTAKRAEETAGAD